jgi:hypothetical protein
VTLPNPLRVASWRDDSHWFTDGVYAQGIMDDAANLTNLTQNPGRERLTVEQIKNALAVTIDNITETAAMLGVSRQTIHWYINKYPELQQYRADVISMLCDKARSNICKRGPSAVTGPRSAAATSDGNKK